LSASRCLPLLLWLAACAKSGGAASQQTRPDPSAELARVGRVSLSEADLERAMAREPGATAKRFQSPQARRELLEGLVRFELLAQAADRAGLMQDPDAIHAQRQIAVTKLVNQALGAVGAPESISRADVEREYLARQASDFTLPPAVRVRHILVSDEQQAKSLVKRAGALAASDDAGFAELATQSSEDATTRGSGGDLGFVDAGSKLPAALVQAALALKTPGEVTGPIAVDRGYEVLRLVSLRAAAVSPLSSVEEPLRQRLYRERRARALDDLVARLRKETPVELHAAK
jgi:peptidyl-prolyl cis-trans isomerase C